MPKRAGAAHGAIGLVAVLRIVLAAAASAQTFSTAGSVPSTWGWVERAGAVPDIRNGHGGAYDSIRARFVMFGGVKPGQQLGDTWEWDGTTWTQKTPATSPALRSSFAMTFDARRGRVVLFGGYRSTGDQTLNDTWEWDGTNWQQMLPATSPSVRLYSSLAYDTARSRVVLFGGSTPTGSRLQDTWEWDGVNWTALDPAVKPPARYLHSLAYDSTRSRTVLFGGRGSGAVPDQLNDTWEWDGISWQQRFPVSSPSIRESHSLVQDTRRGRIVLFGGLKPSPTVITNETWEWDGVTWTQISPNSSPQAREQFAMAFDSLRGCTVIFAGHLGSDQYINDTWEYDGVSWTLESVPTSAPPARTNFSMAYDGARKRVLLAGGCNDAGTPNDTWEWDGVQWAQRSPASLPGAQTDSPMSFDAARGKILLFRNRQTWEWDGNNWELRTPVSAPEQAGNWQSTFDSTRNRVVLFGVPDGVTNTKTWEWDGTAWEDRTPAQSPPDCLSKQLAFHAALGRSVLALACQSGDDTWEWNGTTWTKLELATSFPRRGGFFSAYDSSQGRLFAYGGIDGGVLQNETWAFDGSAWTLQPLAAAPPGRQGHRLVYDSNRARLVLFGGSGVSGCASARADTWEFPSNRPPTISGSFPVARVGLPVTLTATFSDPDGDTPTFRWLQTFGPRVVLTDPASATATFTTTVPGVYGFQITASDGRGGNAFAMGDRTLSLNAPPTGVTASASAARMTPGASVALSASAVDADGDALSYAWSIESGPAGGVISNPAIRTPTFTATTSGSYTIKLTASDGFGGVGTSFVTITVTPVGTAFSTARSVPSTWGWVRRDAPIPSSRNKFSLAYDSRRARTVLFGGLEGSTVLGDTWEWDGESWLQRSPVSSPPARRSGILAYDSARGRTVLFGGVATGYLRDTWEWDGTNWLQRTSTTSPPARQVAAAVYDASRKSVLLFGGVSSAGAELSDTWEWDGTEWRQLLTPSSPSARYEIQMAYDARRQRTVLFSGRGPGQTNDTWEFNGSDWVRRSLASAPPARGAGQMVYDSRREKTILFGGFTESNLLFQDVWEFDGDQWLERSPTSRPPARGTFGMTFDELRGRAILFGGNVDFAAPSATANDTWEYDGTNWKLASAQLASPPERHRSGLAYDAARSRMVLFGGAASTNRDDTWEWDGTVWQQFAPASSPGVRFGHVMAYDPSLERVLLFGGSFGSQVKDDTWEWDGINWARMTTATSPPARTDPAFAFDSMRSEALLFSGFIPAGGPVLTDTWSLHGSTWTQRSSPAVPASRSNPGAAFDSRRSRVVIFGGYTTTGDLADTWEWDGTAWLQRFPSESPPAGEKLALTFDSIRNRVMFFGGRSAAGGLGNDTWEWDGVSWTRLSPASRPPARTSHALGYDAGRRRCFLFGGNDGSSLPDTWELPSNRPPVLTATRSSSPLFTGRTVTLAADFSDPDGDTPTFRWQQTFGPRVALQNATSALATFATTIATSYGFQAIASDGREGYAFALDSLTVLPSITGVSINASATRVLPGAAISLTGNATSQIGATLSYAWTIRSPANAPATALTNANTRAPAFSTSTPGVYLIELTVSDGSGSSERAVVSLTVNTPPAVSAGADRTVAPGTTVTLSASASDADTGDALSYSWTQTGGPGLTIPTPSAASITVTPGSAAVFTFSVTVTDSRAGTATDSVSVTASAPQPNLVPSAVSADRSSVPVNELLAVTATVRNTGNAASSAARAQFLLSSSAAVDAAAPVLGTTSVPSLLASGNITISGHYAVPASIAPGSYFAAVRVDSDGTVAESAETDNTAVSASAVVISPAIVKIANLVAQSVNPSSSTLFVGDSFTASAFADNSGTLDITRTFGAAFFLSTDATFESASDAPLATAAIPGIPVGASASLFPSLRVPDALTPGRYFLLFALDPSSQVVESSRSDNVVASPEPIDISARPSGAPLTATLAIAPGRLVVPPAAVTVTATFSEALQQAPSIQLSSSSGKLLGGTMAGPLPGRVFAFAQPFNATDNGAWTVTLRASTASGSSLAQQPLGASFTIRGNRPPTVDAGPARLASSGALVRLTGTALDLDGDPLVYSWTGPLPLAGASTLTPSFTPATTGTFTFTLSADDRLGGLATSSVQVRVVTFGSVKTDRIELSGIARLQSGEFPPSGSQLQVTNLGKNAVRASPIAADSGFYALKFEDFEDFGFVQSGHQLVFRLLDPAGVALQILEPPEAVVSLTDEAVRRGALQVDVLAAGSVASSGVLETIAGTGSRGSTGDGGPALAATLNFPVALAVAGNGDIFVAEGTGARVRRFAIDGAIQTVAGNGKLEPGDQSGAATSVAIGSPFGLALSDDNKLYIADRSGNRIRELDLGTRQIRPIAGNGVSGFGGDGGQALAASLRQPRGLAFRSTNGVRKLFVADAGNHRIRAMDLAGGTIETVAGTGSSASLDTPAGLAFDASGRLLVTELGGHRLLRVDLSSGSVETLAGSTGVAGSLGDGGSASRAQLFGPVRVAVRPSGDIVTAERDGSRLRLIDTAGKIRTLAGNGQTGVSTDGLSALNAALGNPQGLAISGDTVLFADTSTHRVRRIRVPTQRLTDDHPGSPAGVGAASTLVAGGPSVAGEIERGGDEDFFGFEGDPGFVYELRTVAGTLGDTVLTLFDRDRTLENDDDAGSRVSRIFDFRPSVSGTYFARVKAFSPSATGTYSVVLARKQLSADPIVVTTGLPPALAGVDYGFTLEAAGGLAPYTFTLVSGALPPGLSPDFSGRFISGRPLAAGSFRFTVLAKDSNGRSAPPKTFVLEVGSRAAAGLPESPHPYPAAFDDTRTFQFDGAADALDVTFDEQTAVETGFDFIEVTDGSGALVEGGRFTGRELAGRTLRIPGSRFGVRLISDGNVSDFGYRVVRVTPAALGAAAVTLDIRPPVIPGARAGQEYARVVFEAPGAVQPLLWSVSEVKSLPPGITIDTASGRLSGASTAPGEYTFDVRVQDATGAVGLRRYVLPVFAPAAGNVLPESFHPYADATEDVQSFTLSGSPPAILVTFDGRTELEAGFDFLHVTDGSGVAAGGSPFTGTDLAGRTLRIAGDTVRLRLVSDGTGSRYGYRVLSVTRSIAAPGTLAFVTPPGLPPTGIGVGYSQQLTASGGVEPYSFSLISGELPRGLLLDPLRGVLSGAAGQSGRYEFGVQLGDSSRPPSIRQTQFSLEVSQGDPPEVAVVTTRLDGVLEAAIRVSRVVEPLSQVVVLVSFDAALLDAPQPLAGDLSPEPPDVQVLARGLVRIRHAEPPEIDRAGILVRLQFEVRPGANPGPGAVTILSSEFSSSRGQILRLRPTANAGVSQVIRLSARPAIPDPVALAPDNSRPFVRLDGRLSADPNRPALPLTYRWTQLRGVPVTLSASATAIPTFLPPREGEYAFALTVANGRLESPASETSVLAVGSNSPPQAEVLVTPLRPNDAYLAGRDTVTLDGSISTDPDSLDVRALEYAWRQVAGPSVPIEGQTTSPSLRFLPNTPGRAAFELVVTDPAGATSPPRRIEILVRSTNTRVPGLSLQATAPSTTGRGSDLGDGAGLKLLESLRVRLPTRVTLKALVNDSDVGRPPLKAKLTFEWRQLDGPAVRLDEPALRATEQLVSTVAFEPTTAGLLSFECVVSKLDSNGGMTGVEASRQIRVAVDGPGAEVPRALVQSVRTVDAGASKQTVGLFDRPGEPVTALPGETVLLAGTALAGPDVNGLRYSWSQNGGPPVVLSNPFASVTTFVTPELRGELEPRELRFQLVVTDDGLPSEPALAVLRVVPPSAGTDSIFLRRGLSLVSLPIDPSTTDGPYSSAEVVAQLLERSGGYLARVRSGGRFEIYQPGLSRAPFPIVGNQGYLMFRPGNGASKPLRGRPWTAAVRQRSLETGLNAISFPAGVPPGYDADRLARLTGASQVIRIGPEGRFETFIPGLGHNFEIQRGSAYLLSVPSARTISMPGDR